MSEQVIWEVGDDIYVEIFVGDPATGAGISGQTAFIALTIQRDYDSKFWTGSAWSATRTTLLITEVDSVNELGRYVYILPSTANTLITRYSAHGLINNPPMFENVDSYEFHFSRVTKFYESEAD